MTAPVELNTDAVLTEEMIEKLKIGLGVEKPVKRQWHSEATRDTIKHWSFGIGDDNPLYVDEAYGKTTQWGTNLAPPSFLYSAGQGPRHEGSEPSKGSGLPGIHAVWAGDSWEYFRPIVRGTAIDASTMLAEVKMHHSQFGGLTAELVTENTFRTSAGDLLAKQRVTFMHHGRRVAASQNKYKDVKRHVWTDQELAKLNADIDLERRRGAKNLRYDDVQPGEVIPHVVKGPLTVSEMVTFVQGWGGPFMMASEIAHKYIRKHPAANVPDREMRVPDFPERAHWDADFARECGFPDGYDFGSQRIGWMVNGLTNWMGDNAQVRKIQVKLVRLNIPGDATWCTGTVSGKHISDDGERCIDLEITATNQRGEKTALGTATVIAPE